MIKQYVEDVSDIHIVRYENGSQNYEEDEQGIYSWQETAEEKLQRQIKQIERELKNDNAILREAERLRELERKNKGLLNSIIKYFKQ